MKSYLKIVAFIVVSAIILGLVVPTLVSAKSGVAFGLGVGLLFIYLGFVLNFIIKKLTHIEKEI